jgi:diacylglycerol kinase family enzyme
VRTVTIEGTPIAMQLDGDHVGTTPTRISIQPSALHVLLTHGAAQTLRLAPWGMEKS